MIAPVRGAGAAKRPDNKRATQPESKPLDMARARNNENGQAKAWPLPVEARAEPSECYFAAVGNGTGLSESVCR